MKNYRFNKRYDIGSEQRIIPGYGLCRIDENLTDDMVEAAQNAGIKGVFEAVEPEPSQTKTSDGKTETNGRKASKGA